MNSLHWHDNKDFFNFLLRTEETETADCDFSTNLTLEVPWWPPNFEDVSEPTPSFGKFLDGCGAKRTPT